jgi:hypothetical protein
MVVEIFSFCKEETPEGRVVRKREGFPHNGKAKEVGSSRRVQARLR